MWKLFWLILGVLFLGGCSQPSIQPLDRKAPLLDGDHFLAGRVEMGRQIQASLSEVASASTVSLINIETKQTVTTALTDSEGRFVLKFSNAFHADPAATYYLEAIKGLASNQPGRPAARVRTIARYTGGWTTLSNTQPNSGIVLSSSTTAVAIGGALRGISDFSPFIGSVTPSGAFAPVGSLSGSDFQDLLGLVQQILASDADPVAQIGRYSDAWVRLDRPLSLMSLSPTSGAVGSTIEATGSALSLTPDNVVRFNGTVAAAAASPNTVNLRVVVPSGATSGQTLLTVGGLSALGPLFTVLPQISAVSPRAGLAGDATGRDGSLVTISGEGFGPTGTVSLNGSAATVVSWSNRSITFALPYGATTGPVTITTGGNLAIGPTVSVVSNLAQDGSFESVAIGADPSSHGFDGGNTIEAIVATTTARSGSKVLRLSGTTGAHRILFPGLTATQSIIVAGAWVRANTNLNPWANASGTLSGRGVIPATAQIWGTPWLTYYNGGLYPDTVDPHCSSMTCYAQGQTWQYLQAVTSAQLGQNYQYGLALMENPWVDNGLLFDIDDVVLFQSD